MFEDKTLVCKDCGNEFVFTAGEQEFYAQKGLVNTPKRCPECRKARKHKSKRKMYDFQSWYRWKSCGYGRISF